MEVHVFIITEDANKSKSLDLQMCSGYIPIARTIQINYHDNT